MEGSETVDGPLSNVNRTQKANDGGLYGHCPEADRLHVGRCKGGAGDQIIGRRIELASRAWAGAEQRQGNTRQTLCGRHSTDVLQFRLHPYAIIMNSRSFGRSVLRAQSIDNRHQSDVPLTLVSQPQLKENSQRTGECVSTLRIHPIPDFPDSGRVTGFSRGNKIEISSDPQFYL